MSEVIKRKFAASVSVAFVFLHLASIFVYAGFLYLPFSKSYSPTVYVYDNYTLNKGWPTYGPTTGSAEPHTGTDYRGDGYGTPVYASAGGTVVAMRESENDQCDITYQQQLRDGNYVIVNHGNGYRTEYWHLRQWGVVVKKGDKVKVGDLIAYISNSGRTRGSDCPRRSDLPYGAYYHLHFEVKRWDGKKWVVANPYNEWTGWLWKHNPPKPATSGSGSSGCIFSPGENSSRKTLFQKAYNRVGGWEKMGCANGPTYWWKGMVRQDFPGKGKFGPAAILHYEGLDKPKYSIPAYVVHGGIWKYYRDHPTFGPPVSDEYTNAFGRPQSDFRDGFVYWSKHTGAQARSYFLEGSSSTIYLLAGGRKYPLPNSQTKDALGYPIAIQTVSESALAVFSAGDPIPSVDDIWLAQYFDNMVRRRPAKVIEAESNLNFNWGHGSPHSSIPKDKFSAIFSKRFNFAAGLYEFSTTVDDETEIYLNNDLIGSQGLGSGSFTHLISSGTHLLQIHYHEGSQPAYLNFSFKRLDITPPKTSISHHGPSYVSDDGKFFISSETHFALEAEDDLSGVARTDYQIDDGVESIYEEEFGVAGEDGQHGIKYWSTDAAGNVEPRNTQEIYLDSTPPVSSDDSDGEWYNTDVTVTITADDGEGSGVKEIIYKGSQMGVREGTQTEVMFEEEGIHELSYHAVDNVENVEEEKIAAPIKIDKTPPVSKLDELDPYYDNDPLGEDPIVLAHASSDNLSGVEKVRLYKREPGEDWEYHGGSSREPAKKFNVKTLNEGRWEFASGAVDFAENVESFPEEADTSMIYDITPPTSEITSIEESGYYNAGTWPGIFGTADDTNPRDPSIVTSGIREVQVRVDKDDAEGDWSLASGLSGWLFSGFTPEDGFYAIYFQATDRAGNQESTSHISFVYDATPPATVGDISGEKGLDGWYVSSATLSLKAEDAISGVSQIFYRIGGSDPQIYEGLLSFDDGSYLVEFWSVDKAGNEEEHQTRSFKIDTIALGKPIASVRGGTFLEGERITVLLTSKGGSQIYYFFSDGRTILYHEPLAISADAFLSAYTVDEAGNRGEIASWEFIFKPHPAPQSEPLGEIKGLETVAGKEEKPKSFTVWWVTLAVLLGGGSYFFLRRIILLLKRTLLQRR